MIVIMMAMTPSLNAARRSLPMLLSFAVVTSGPDDPTFRLILLGHADPRNDSVSIPDEVGPPNGEATPKFSFAVVRIVLFSIGLVAGVLLGPVAASILNNSKNKQVDRCLSMMFYYFYLIEVGGDFPNSIRGIVGFGMVVKGFRTRRGVAMTFQSCQQGVCREVDGAGCGCCEDRACCISKRRDGRRHADEGATVPLHL